MYVYFDINVRSDLVRAEIDPVAALNGTEFVIAMTPDLACGVRDFRKSCRRADCRTRVEQQAPRDSRRNWRFRFCRSWLELRVFWVRSRHVHVRGTGRLDWTDADCHPRGKPDSKAPNGRLPIGPCRRRYRHNERQRWPLESRSCGGLSCVSVG